ncbi:hypothetical protein [Antrihabitans cavernicola]|uniref:Uncharacterized protein n=1 Tax=Antrihabitans cavernicola TaxID=2495913 RepID=A0A5A7S769_9NOCA|nr:hypothetical protein [Spelaeibacter cavernicola]KAA0020213.1 hypothetical protein FOY51_21785 [Spelaeibacter cavernicola]
MEVVVVEVVTPVSDVASLAASLAEHATQSKPTIDNAAMRTFEIIDAIMPTRICAAHRSTE